MLIRYGKTGLSPLTKGVRGLLGQATPTYTPTYTPIYMPPPTYTPAYTPAPPTYTPAYTPPGKKRRVPSTPLYQGTPSYAPPPTGAPTQINPEDAGLYPEGSIPPQLVPSGEGQGWVYAGGGAFGPSLPVEEEITEEVPVEEPKKTNWLLWLTVAAGVYLLFGGEIL